MHSSRAVNALNAYDAIKHDLTIRWSSVLEQRLADAEADLLAATGAESVTAARMEIDTQPASADTLASKREPRANRKNRSPRENRLEGLSEITKALGMAVRKPPRGDGGDVVEFSGGLPGTSREH